MSSYLTESNDPGLPLLASYDYPDDEDQVVVAPKQTKEGHSSLGGLTAVVTVIWTLAAVGLVMTMTVCGMWDDLLVNAGDVWEDVREHLPQRLGSPRAVTAPCHSSKRIDPVVVHATTVAVPSKPSEEEDRFLGDKMMEPHTKSLYGQGDSTLSVTAKASVLLQGSKNFRDFSQTKGVVLISFCSPWCTWCQRLQGTWEQLAVRAKAMDTSWHVGQVDCSLDEEFCRDEQIIAFPTFRAYRHGERILPDYQSDRTVSAFLEYARGIEKSTSLYYYPHGEGTTTEDEERHRSASEDAPWGEALEEDRDLEGDGNTNRFFESSEDEPLNLKPLKQGIPAAAILDSHEDRLDSSPEADESFESDDDYAGVPAPQLNEEDVIFNPVDENGQSPPKQYNSPDEVGRAKPMPVPLTSANWSDAMGKKFAFINLSAPWCVWCQRLTPTWEKLAHRAAQADLPVMIGQVDCMADADLCHREKIMAFPTLRFYSDGQPEVPDYKMDRTVDALMEYIERKMHFGPTVETLTDSVPEDESEDEDGSVDLSHNAEAAEQDTAEDWFLSPEDGRPSLFEEEDDSSLDAAVERVEAIHVEAGGLSESMPSSEYVGGSSWNLPMTKEFSFIFFFAPWCTWSQRLAPIWERFARDVAQAELPVMIGHIDCIQDADLCRNQDIRAFPTVRFYHNGERQLPDYKLDRTVEALMGYLRRKIATETRTNQLEK